MFAAPTRDQSSGYPTFEYPTGAAVSAVRTVVYAPISVDPGHRLRAAGMPAGLAKRPEHGDPASRLRGQAGVRRDPFRLVAAELALVACRGAYLATLLIVVSQK